MAIVGTLVLAQFLTILYPLPCGRNSWLRSVGSRLTGDFSGANHNLFYNQGSNLRCHSPFHHGNAEQYCDGGILSTTPQCFFYNDYPSGLVTGMGDHEAWR